MWQEGGMEEDFAAIEHNWSVSEGKIGPVQLYCTGPTFFPYRLISCLQLAHNTPRPPVVLYVPSSMVPCVLSEAYYWWCLWRGLLIGVVSCWTLFSPTTGRVCGACLAVACPCSPYCTLPACLPGWSMPFFGNPVRTLFSRGFTVN